MKKDDDDKKINLIEFLSIFHSINCLINHACHHTSLDWTSAYDDRKLSPFLPLLSNSWSCKIRSLSMCRNKATQWNRKEPVKFIVLTQWTSHNSCTRKSLLATPQLLALWYGHKAMEWYRTVSVWNIARVHNPPNIYSKIIKIYYLRRPHISFQTPNNWLVNQTFSQCIKEHNTNNLRAIIRVENILVISWNKVIVQVRANHQHDHVRTCQPHWTVQIRCVISAIHVYLIFIVVHENSCSIEWIIF